MATTFYADNYKANAAYSSQEVGVSVTREFEFTITAAWIINDVVKLAPIPALVILTEWFADVPDLDTGVALLLDWGDATTAAKYAAASTIGQALGKLYSGTAGVAAAVPAKYEEANAFQVKVNTAATGAAATGTLKGWIRYHAYGYTTL